MYVKTTVQLVDGGFYMGNDLFLPIPYSYSLYPHSPSYLFKQTLNEANHHREITQPFLANQTTQDCKSEIVVIENATLIHESAFSNILKLARVWNKLSDRKTILVGTDN